MKTSKQWAVRLLAVLVLLAGGCSVQDETGTATGPNAPGKRDAAKVHEIIDADEFRSVIASSPALTLVDFYADWCAPCKELEPILKAVARENPQQARIFRIDMEQNRALAQSLGMRGIPFVVYFKNHQVVHQRVGLYPKNTYLEDIQRLF